MVEYIKNSFVVLWFDVNIVVVDVEMMYCLFVILFKVNFNLGLVVFVVF